MLNVRNVLNDAERAKDKKAPIGVDVTIENFSDEIIDGIDLLDDLDDVSKKVATLDTVFGFIDGVSNKMAYLGGKLTQGVVGLINKVTGLKRRKDEDDFYE